MNEEKFEGIVNEIRERIGVTPDCISTDICEFIRCKDKGWLHRTWHNLKTGPEHLGAANTKTKRIWISPYLIRFGSENMVRNTLAHEMIHLKIKKDKKDNIDILPLVKKLKDTKDKTEILEIGKKIIVGMLDIQKPKIKEETVTKEIADTMYPVYKGEETTFFLKTFILHPKTAFEMVFAFGTALAIAYAAQVVSKTDPILGMMLLLAYLGLQLIIFIQKTRRL